MNEFLSNEGKKRKRKEKMKKRQMYENYFLNDKHGGT